ncbi:hypothetical protein KA005_05180 [bacterium]|nr:hypothetical protein [bacterium]
MKLSISHCLDHTRVAYHILSGLVVGSMIGLLIVQDDTIFLLIGFFLASRLIFFTNPKVSFFIIIFSIFFADWLSTLGLIPVSFTWLPDVALIILFGKVVVLKIRKVEIIRTPIDIPMLLFILWAIISMLVNNGSIISMLLSFRQLLKFAFLFFIIINLEFNERYFKHIMTVLVILFAIQVPTALVKMLIYGRGEFAIGTYAYFGGGLSTILPLFVLSAVLGFFFYKSGRWNYIFFLVYFQLFYFACPKRAYPMFAFVLFPFLLWQAGRKNWKKILPLTPVIALAMAVLLFMNPDLNSALDNPKGVIDWASSYTYQKDDELTSGRVAVAEYVFNKLHEEPIHLLVGLGPGTMTEGFEQSEEGLRATMPIYYGLTEFSTMSLEYGGVGVLIFLWIIFRLFMVNQRMFHQLSEGYWKAVSFAFKGIWFTCLLAFFYGPVFRLDLSAFIFWFFAAMVSSVYLQGQNKGMELKQSNPD